MTVNDIIILDNDARYTLLEETIESGIKYFLAASIDEEENIDVRNLVLLKHVLEEDGDYVEVVDDKDLISKLAKNIVDAN